MTRVPDGMIFVFGSNLAGRHGAGAAKFARDRLRAKPGVARGPTGRCYALPTKDAELRTRPLDEIKQEVDDFIDFAVHSDQMFYLTPVGCGLAGHDPRAIAKMFLNRLPRNVVLAPSWLEHF